MAFYRHLIDVLRDVVPEVIAPAPWAERRLALQSHPSAGGCLRSRWTHARA